MPILRLVAEGVGPFEKLDLDLSDGQGNPHLGPHILAGINGSGKSTVLKTIAWVLRRDGWGFDLDEWKQAMAGHAAPRAALGLKAPGMCPGVEAVAMLEVSRGPHVEEYGLQWLQSAGLLRPSTTRLARSAHRTWLPDSSTLLSPWWLRDWGENLRFDPRTSWPGSVAAYAPSRKLKYLASLDITGSKLSPFENALAFGDTVRNEIVQAWMVRLHSSLAIARQAHQPFEEYSQALSRFEAALQLIYDGHVRLVPVLKPLLHPELQVGSQRLNFSQLPDGIRATIGWLSDYMMRQDLMHWDPQLEGKRPGLLLLDEIDAHLHPRWQRTLLPAVRQALPDVQIIVTSHSPFVINSCPGSRVHLFDRYENGQAYLKQSCDAPIGHSVMATLKDIFGIDSRFDIRTERELDEWYQLSRREAVGPLPDSDRQRKEELTRILSERSESLKAIVFRPTDLSAVLKAVENSAPRQEKAG
jgi:energy-coupling factor transporter ATP-binding protein EcfA2